MVMIWRLARFGVSAGALQLVLAAGAAYLVWEHDQGRHTQPNLLCPICLMNRIVPAPEAPEAPEAPDEATTTS